MNSELTLSPETLAALKEFAVSSRIIRTSDETDNVDLISKITKHFDIKDKYDVFSFQWTNDTVSIEFSVTGIKKELGQTLSSTGLTMYVIKMF
jgi:hypothetical protein